MTLFILLFIGLVFGGDAVLVPTIFFTVTGVLPVSMVLPLVLVAVIAADSLWYILGTRLPRERLEELPYLRGRKDLIFHLSKVFDTRSLLIIFVSKFVHGTRLIVQLLCGIHKINYFRFISISVLGSIAWISFLTLLAFSLKLSIVAVEDVVRATQIALLLFFVIVIVTHILIRWWLRKKIF